MRLQQQQIVACFAFIACNYCASVFAGFASSAGFVGNYAGHLAGGQALSELSGAHNLDAEVHDFGESSHQNYESLSSLGHADGSSSSAEYAETAAASEYHPEIESYGHQEQYNEVELGGEHYYGGSTESLYSELENKPVRGIDHGKGAFSYSTLYESKEDKEETHL